MEDPELAQNNLNNNNCTLWKLFIYLVIEISQKSDIRKEFFAFYDGELLGYPHSVIDVIVKIKVPKHCIELTLLEKVVEIQFVGLLPY